MTAPPIKNIALLADVMEAISVLARAFTEEWEPYYGARGPGDATGDLTACCNREDIPLALVALDDKAQVLGTAALKPDPIETHRHLGPWLAALLVLPGHRGMGVGTALVTAIEDEARRLQYGAIYTATRKSSRLITGWDLVDDGVPTLREPTTIFRRNLPRHPDEQ